MICDAISAGNYDRVAALYAGIDVATYYRWKDLGEQAQTGLFRDFYEAIRKAEAQAQVRNVAIVQRAANTQWQAAAWWLERKHADEWGRRDNLNVGGDKDKPILIRIVYDRPQSELGDIIEGEHRVLPPANNGINAIRDETN